MTWGRKWKSSVAPTPMSTHSQKINSVMPHNEFIDRIRKTLYFGGGTLADEMEVSRPLAEYASELFSEPHKGHSLNRLNSVAAGSVHATPCSLIMALIYLDRINVTDPGYARRITPQELFIVSMMISTKFYSGYDEEIYLSDWAEDGNMTEEKLKKLELDFLYAIDWNIYISNDQFFNKLQSIEKAVAQREGVKRGWLTYTELSQMLPSFLLAKFLLHNITVMAVSYAASVMTIAGAFFLASQIPGHLLHRKSMLYDDSMTSVSQSATELRTSPDRPTNASQATTVTVELTPNDTTCTAINVELELLNLERQYREEALLDDLRSRNNEIEADSRLTLPASVGSPPKEHHMSILDAQRNWLMFKEEYRDGSQLMNTLKMNEVFEPAVKKDFFQLDNFLSALNNCTSSSFLLWQMMTDTARESFARLPMMWLKFM